MYSRVLINQYPTPSSLNMLSSYVKTIINSIQFPTPLGSMLCCASNKGICLLDFTDSKNIEVKLKNLSKRLNASILSENSPYLEQVQTELSEYFVGNRKKFSVPLHTTGTDFQKRAWTVLQEIPYAKTLSYKQQAIAINHPKAVRAVASANGQNCISIIIPCHRVIGTDGQLTGYAGGVNRKKWLLDFESSHFY